MYGYWSGESVFRYWRLKAHEQPNGFVSPVFQKNDSVCVESKANTLPDQNTEFDKRSV